MKGDGRAGLLRVAGIVPESPVDGPGLRFAIFTQGCPHRCPGCHNPHTHDPAEGYDMAVDELVTRAAATPLISGVTLSGGEPLAQAETAGALVRGLKAAGLHVIVYTGYIYEDISQNPACADVLDNADVLVDGPFVAERRTLELRFRGSLGQRVIDLPNTRAKGAVVELEW